MHSLVDELLKTKMDSAPCAGASFHGDDGTEPDVWSFLLAAQEE